MELVIGGVEALRARMTSAFEEAVDGPFSCILTGGATALLYLGALRAARVDWSQVTLYWGDERAVPADDPGSNFGVARRVLLDPLRRIAGPRGPRVFPMPGDHRNLGDAAMAYDHVLDHELKGHPADLAILGVGEDGHVCALFPGERALLEELSRVVAVENAPKPPPRRLTMTLPFLLHSRALWIVAVGPRKRRVLQAAVSRSGHSTPIDLILQRGRNLTVFTDQAVHL